MKHLLKFNESIEEDKQDIKDNFQFITDKFGEPYLIDKKWSESYKYIIKWNLGLNLGNLNEASVVVNKLKSIVEEIDDVLSAKDRMSNFNFAMSITNSLIIE